MQTSNTRVAVAIAGAIAILAAGTPLARAQTPPPAAPTVPAYRYRILGVFDEATGEAVEGADVIDVPSGTKATTTKTGTVSLIFLPDGGSLVRIRKLGYEAQTFMVAIAPTDAKPITVLLKPATTLPTVVITDTAKDLTPRLRVFEEHRKTAMGQFLAEDAFRKAENSTMANLLSSRFTGLQQVTTQTGAVLLASSRVACQGLALAKCNSPNCYVTIYIDGVRVFDYSMPGSAARDMSRLSPIDYAAAEFYPGGATLPSGLSPTNSKCGSLVLYTRDR